MLARRLGLQLHTHLAETVEEDAYCRELYGCRPVEYLAERGWLDADVWCAHCVHLSASDVAAFGSHGVGVAHCPTSNLRLGAGVAPVRELLDAGVRVGLGVDGSASNERSDLAFEVKQALLVARGRGGPAALTAREALGSGPAAAPRSSAGTTSACSRPAAAPTSRSGGSTAWRSRARPIPSAAGSSACRIARIDSSSAAATSSATATSSTPTRPRSLAPIANRREDSRHDGLVSRPTSSTPARADRPQASRSSCSATGTGRAARTDEDGRIVELAAALEPGLYRLAFEPPSLFFRRVELEVELVEGHYHVPLLVSPYGCASYRGG